MKFMFAEFFDRVDGYCKGRGGSMHIADPSEGNLGANGIVGGGIPIAVGAALSAKKEKLTKSLCHSSATEPTMKVHSMKP